MSVDCSTTGAFPFSFWCACRVKSMVDANVELCARKRDKSMWRICSWKECYGFEYRAVRNQTIRIRLHTHVHIYVHSL